MKNKTSVKNKTRMKNKTHKGVGGKKLRSKTNRRKYKSRFSKKTLKRGGGTCTSKNGNKGDARRERASENELSKNLSEVDELTKALTKALEMIEDPNNSILDDDDDKLLKELEAEGEGTLSEEEVLKQLEELENELEELEKADPKGGKVKGGTRTPDQIRNQIKIWITSLKDLMAENNARIATLSALTNRTTKQEEQLRYSLLYKKRLTLLSNKIKKCVGLLQSQKNSIMR